MAELHLDQVIFIDIESTGLDPDRHVPWDIAIIAKNEEYEQLVVLTEEEMAAADPRALDIGHFQKRYLDVQSQGQERTHHSAFTVAQEVARLTDGKHLVGANPRFDAAFLERLLWRNGANPKWSYHLIDVEALMLGALAERGLEVPIPWKSVQLSEMLGIPGPSEEERHTAMGDSRWCKRIFEVVLGHQVQADVNLSL
jgi:oligoribonuclease (3'-5' exoribonuclease)